MTLKKYSMKSASSVAAQATTDIEKYLKSLPETVAVINVENDSTYRQKDIDIIWRRKEREVVTEVTIEVKGDRYFRTGNYFFETISNKSKGTPGCFMYTEADFIYYYFVDEKELHILPMPETRDWFIPRINKFEERETSTPVGNGKYYITVGRLVPRKIVAESVNGVQLIHLNKH